MAVTAITILFILFIVLVIANSTTDKSEMQQWLMGILPILGTFLLIAMGATLLAAIPVILQQISNFLK